ncbi:SIP1 domain-containing protein, partial [Cephalotus follicularis]
MESDTCVGLKRRIVDVEEENHYHGTILKQQQREERDSKESFLIVSSPKEETENSPKKVKCSFFESESNIGDNQGLWFGSDSEETQEAMDSVSEKVDTFGEMLEETEIREVGLGSDFVKNEELIGSVEETLKGEMGFSGIQEFEKKSLAEFCDEKREFVGEGIEADGLLKAKKKKLLEEIDAGLIFVAKTHVNKVTGQEVHGRMVHSDADVRCSLKYQVIDDTALIESVPVSVTGNGNVKEAGVVGFADEGTERKEKKNEKQEVVGKKAKRSRRKAKEAKRDLETSKRNPNLNNFVEVQNGGRKNGDGNKVMYSREEMEAMRFIDIVEQRKSWKGIYTGLAPAVKKEYDELASSHHQKKIPLKFDPWQQFGRKEEVPRIPSESCSEIVDSEIGNLVDNEIENVNSLDTTCNDIVVGEDANEFLEDECSEDDDSDENYASIQRPALMVEGEPNFDSGPPEDGLEFLRRVRWEAARIPKVKVAKFDRSKLNEEQSVYMPQIPDIASCPEHLLPLKQWEDAFLADFSELRLALSSLNNCGDKIFGKLQSEVIVHKEKSSGQFHENIIIEKFNNLSTDDVHFDQPIDNNESSIERPSIVNAEDHKTSASNLSLRTSVIDISRNNPTLSAVLGLSSVSRFSLLRKFISSLETMSTLSRSDCAWLFALCAAVDTPLDADASAALRSLLRWCASLRVEKSEIDDEVIMLNILATISGRYFGQLET